MWPFGKPAKLLRQLNRLAFYNDKGIDYSRHGPADVEAHRSAALAEVRETVAAVGPENLPHSFVAAVDSGEVATDPTGQYIDLLRAHFGHSSAP